MAIKAIVTAQNDDGSYSEVGTNTRRVTKAYTSERTLMRYGLRWCPAEFGVGRRIRIEMFQGERIPTDENAKPFKTVYATTEDIA